MNTLNFNNSQLLTILNNLSKFQGHKTIDYFNNLSFYFEGPEVFISSGQPGIKFFVPVNNTTGLSGCEVLFSETKDLLKLISKTGFTNLDFQPENNKLIITSGKDKFSYGITFDYNAVNDCIKSEPYPDYFYPGQIAEVKKHICKDELRPAMCGIYFHNIGNKLTSVSTDAHTLIKIDTGLQMESDSYIMPAEIFTFFFSLKDVPVFYYFNYENNKNTVFSYFVDNGNIFYLNFDRVDARYPDYSCVIPADNSIETTFDVNELDTILNKGALFVNKITKAVKLSINGSLQINASDIDRGKEYTADMPCTHTGDDLTICFNLDLLKRCLASLENKKANLLLKSATRAGLFKENNKTMLIMPVMSF